MIKQPCPNLSLLKSHPQWGLANKIFQTLSEQGYETYLAGGCVRDLLLGLKPKDIDIATAAAPAEIVKLFKRTINVGENFGVIRVAEDGQDIEVATFRKDGDYKDGRHPEAVIFSGPENDAQRRDFTINALFLQPQQSEIIDYVGGCADLAKRQIKTVGQAEKRFQEDHLRLFRAVRFTAQLDFSIDATTWSAIQKNSSSIKTVSPERIRDELSKLLNSPYALKGLELFITSGLFKALFGEPPPQTLKTWQCLLPVTAKTNGFLWLAFFWPLLQSVKTPSEWELAKSQVRPTKDDERNFKIAQDFILGLSHWRQRRLGEKILFLMEPVGAQILTFMAEQDPKWRSDLGELETKLQGAHGGRPQIIAILKGQDVTDLKGSERGRALHQGFLAQLEGAFKSRPEALSWLENYKKGPKA
jgi:tRNA nucleotidyltransferase (CCA-adding enzyme)